MTPIPIDDDLRRPLNPKVDSSDLSLYEMCLFHIWRVVNPWEGSEPMDLKRTFHYLDRLADPRSRRRLT